MDSLTESEIAAVLGELRDAYPGLRIWTEIIEHGGLHWMASGDAGAWFLMTGDLDRFRAEMALVEPVSPPDDERDERGLCAYVHQGPCMPPGEGTA